MTKVLTEVKLSPLFQAKNNIIYCKDKVFIPPDNNLRQQILMDFHSTPVADHSGLQPILARLCASFHWPDIYKDTKIFIQHCSICQ